MDTLIEGFSEALLLLIRLDPQVLEIILLSLRVTGSALFLSVIIGVPLGTVMGMVEFPGKKIVTALLYTGMGFPPVVIGLFVFIMFSASGPFGQLGWLFTARAIVVAQTILSLPLVTSFVMTSVMSIDDNLIKQMKSLGASRKQLYWTVIKEARLGAVVAIAAGFGAVISEVGAVMLVGGNIEGKTRVLTTAIMLETRQGNFGLALALGIILLIIAFITNMIMMKFQHREIK